MTACRSNGKSSHCPYSLCGTRSCASRKKPIPRAKIDDGVMAISRSTQPSAGRFAMVKAMFIDACNARRAGANASMDVVKGLLKDNGKQIEVTSVKVV
jgi:hypothetical protein